MAYIDPHQPDKDVAKRHTIAQDKAEATDFDRGLLFSSGSTYRGSTEALARLRARAAAQAIQPSD